MTKISQIARHLAAWAILMGFSALSGQGLVNGDFSVTDPESPDFGWTLDGVENQITAGSVTVREDGFELLPGLSQSFTLPTGKDFLEIRILDVDLRANGLGEFPDAFQVDMTIDGATHTLSLQQDGTLDYDAAFIVPGAGASGQPWAPAYPVNIRVDIAALPSAVPAALEMGLLAFDANDPSSVTLGPVSLVRLPRLQADVGLTTPFATALEIDVLFNDTDIELPLDVASVSIVTQPSHGTAVVNPLNGRITYTPAADYFGSDSFTYTASDTSGNEAPNAVAVEIEVQPVQDPLTLWRIENFGALAVNDPGQETNLWGDNADPDSDGLPNLVEYFSNLDPSVAQGYSGPYLVRSGSQLFLRYRRSTLSGMDVLGLIQTTTNLAANDWQAIAVPTSVFETGPGYELLQCDLSESVASGETRFYRLKLFLEDPLVAWRIDKFGATAVGDPAREADLWGDMADPDHDGLSNQLEYFSNLDPLVPDVYSGPYFVRSGSQLFLRYRRSSEPDMIVAGVIQTTTDLAADDWKTSAITPSVVETASGYDLLQVDLSEGTASGESRFFRLKLLP